jgi:hypothetical protein
MKIVKYVKNGKIVEMLEVTLNELELIRKTCDFVNISIYDLNNLPEVKGDDTIGVIAGDIYNVLNILDNNYEGEIVRNPDCWFINKEFLKNNYKSIDSLFEFWEILPLLKSRRVVKATRLGWNGNKRPGDEEFNPRMWITYIPGSFIKLRELNPYYEAGLRGDIDIKGRFDLYTPKGYIQPGWVASQEDLISNDWIINF